MTSLGQLSDDLLDQLLEKLERVVDLLLHEHFETMWVADGMRTWKIEGDSLKVDLELEFTNLAPQNMEKLTLDFQDVLRSRIDEEVLAFLSQN